MTLRLPSNMSKGQKKILKRADKGDKQSLNVVHSITMIYSPDKMKGGSWLER